MIVLVVNIRNMRMRMRKGLVTVDVRMGFAGRVAGRVGVLVVPIVQVEVRMRARPVSMLVFVAFAEV